MIRILLLSFLTSSLILSSFGQCEDGRYRNFVFDNFSLTSDIQYGNNLDHNGASTDLFLDIYEPAGDTEVDRPLVIMVHGGSFVGGTKDGSDVVPMCQDLASMGYVVASIQYRLGIAIDFTALTQNAKAAVIRGAQDSKAAVRYFRKDVAENGNTYNIDPEKIYMVGVSAGGFNALNVAYLNTDEEIPSDIDLSDPGLDGGAEGLSGNPGYSSLVAGIVNVAGAIAHPDLMEADEAPVCSFHGTNDLTVPYGSDILYFLQTFAIDSVHGSATVHERADQLGITNCFEIQENQGHVPHVSNELYYDTLLSISSNFLSHLVCPEVELDCEYRHIEIVSSTDDLIANSNFQVWPNPTRNVLNLKRNDSDVLTYSIVDLRGREVQRDMLGQGEIEISVEWLQDGIYLLRIENGLGTKTLRFSKQG